MSRWNVVVMLLMVALVGPVLGAGDHAEDPNLFAGAIYQSVAALLSFSILFIILKKFAWGPILSGLQDRENKIKGDLDEAESANAKAQQLLSEYEQKLAEAHAETRKLLDSARGDADKLRQRLQTEAEEQIADQRQRAAEEIGRAKNTALAEISAHAGELAVSVAGKILQREIDEADTQRLVEQSLGELDKLNN